jgi:hypothetical protein
MKFLTFVAVVILSTAALVAAAMLCVRPAAVAKPAPPPRTGRQVLAELRYENSGDLRDELSGLMVNESYTIRGEDGKPLIITVAQIDAGYGTVIIETRAENGSSVHLSGVKLDVLNRLIQDYAAGK